jgi:hypothetical protein
MLFISIVHEFKNARKKEFQLLKPTSCRLIKLRLNQHEQIVNRKIVHMIHWRDNA